MDTSPPAAGAVDDANALLQLLRSEQRYASLLSMIGALFLEGFSGPRRAPPLFGAVFGRMESVCNLHFLAWRVLEPILDTAVG
jgi:hypothetical protein